MGRYFMDQYSLLHISTGIMCYFWNMSLITSVMIHLAFELLENTQLGMHIINTYLSDFGFFRWPGGKPYADSTINVFGDNVFFTGGWILAKFVDWYGSKKGYYTAHIVNKLQ